MDEVFLKNSEFSIWDIQFTGIHNLASYFKTKAKEFIWNYKAHIFASIYWTPPALFHWYFSLSEGTFVRFTDHTFGQQGSSENTFVNYLTSEPKFCT